MDAEFIWKIIDAGGALGALAILAIYLIVQNRTILKRHDEMVDRHIKLVENYSESVSSVSASLQRLTDKLRTGNDA